MTEVSYGRYVVVEEVGRGAMGIVYRAEDPIIGRKVAIKAINKTFLATVDVSTTEFLERFRREAQVAGGLSHTNIVKVFDLGEDYIVMEFVEGESLAEAVKRARLPQARALEIVQSIADALDYAHGQGITHRDVKPANVMIQTEGTVKVMDFGLARIESSNLTAAGAVLGSASYMAPEIIKGRPADARSDVFSLGVLAYEALTGARPFPGKTVSVIMMNIIREPPLAATEMALPEEYDPIFSKVLAKDPADRYQTAKEFVDALAAAPVSEEAPCSDGPIGGGDSGDVSVVTVNADEIGPVVSGPVPGLATMLEEEQNEAQASDPAEATLLIAEPDAGPGTDLAEATVALGAGRAEATVEDAEETVAVEDSARPETPGSVGGGTSRPAVARSAVPARRRATGGRGALVLGGLLVAALMAVGGLVWLLTRGGPPASPSEPTQASLPPTTTLETLAATASAAATAAASAEVRAAAPAPVRAQSRGAQSESRDGQGGSDGTPAAARSAEVTPPRKIEGGGASLPRDHRDLALPASVLIEFLVTAEGQVKDPRVVESGGEVLDSVCVEAVSSWRYQPATRDGVAVSMRQKARFTFRQR